MWREMDVFSDQPKFETDRKAIAPRTNVYLSLYLVIFGFFVVLVNESEISRPKSTAAMSSVKATFVQDTHIGPTFGVTASDSFEDALTDVEKAEKILRAAFPGAGFGYGSAGRELRVLMNSEAMFYARTAALKPNAKTALGAVASMLSQSQSTDKVVYIDVPAADRDGGDGSDEPSFDVRRGAELASRFVQGGMAQEQLFVGRNAKRQDRISLVIRKPTAGLAERPIGGRS